MPNSNAVLQFDKSGFLLAYGGDQIIKIADRRKQKTIMNSIPIRGYQIRRLVSLSGNDITYMDSSDNLITKKINQDAQVKSDNETNRITNVKAISPDNGHYVTQTIESKRKNLIGDLKTNTRDSTEVIRLYDINNPKESIYTTNVKKNSCFLYQLSNLGKYLLSNPAFKINNCQIYNTKTNQTSGLNFPETKTPYPKYDRLFTPDNKHLLLRKGKNIHIYKIPENQ